MSAEAIRTPNASGNGRPVRTTTSPTTLPSDHQPGGQPVGVVPDAVAGERPGHPNADIEVLPHLAHDVAHQAEEQENAAHQRAADVEPLVAAATSCHVASKIISLHISEQADDGDHDEQVGRAERIDLELLGRQRGEEPEEDQHRRRHQRHQEQGPALVAVAVDLAVDVPVGRHRLGQARVEPRRERPRRRPSAKRDDPVPAVHESDLPLVEAPRRVPENGRSLDRHFARRPRLLGRSQDSRRPETQASSSRILRATAGGGW